MSLIVVNSSVEWNSFNLQIFSHFSLFVSHEIIFRSTINIERALHKPITKKHNTNNNNQTKTKLIHHENKNPHQNCVLSPIFYALLRTNFRNYWLWIPRIKYWKWTKLSIIITTIATPQSRSSAQRRQEPKSGRGHAAAAGPAHTEPADDEQSAAAAADDEQPGPDDEQSDAADEPEPGDRPRREPERQGDLPGIDAPAGNYPIQWVRGTTPFCWCLCRLRL